MNRRDIRNLVALATAQISNMLLPLLLSPYVLSVAGTETYSEFALSEAIGLAVLTVALYSFDLNAIGSVVGKDLQRDSQAISLSFSAVLFARTLMFVAAASLAVGATALLYPALLPYLPGWLLLAASHIVLSAWMFMGLERNGPVAVCVALARCAALIMVVVLVKDPEDGASASAVVGTTSLLAACGLLVYLRYNFGVGLRRVSLASTLELLREGRTVFVGNIAVYLYRDVNVLLLGAFGAGGPAAISVYSLAEKIVKGVQAAARPVNQMLLPKAVRELGSTSGPDVAILRRLVALLVPQLVIVLSGLVFGAGAFLLLSDHVTFIQNVPNIGRVALLAAIMSPAVLFGVGNFVLGSVGLNNLGESTRLLVAIVCTGLINLGLCAVLAATLGGTGAAFAFVLSELLLLLMIVRTYTRRRSSIPVDSRAV